MSGSNTATKAVDMHNAMLLTSHLYLCVINTLPTNSQTQQKTINTTRLLLKKYKIDNMKNIHDWNTQTQGLPTKSVSFHMDY